MPHSHAEAEAEVEARAAPERPAAAAPAGVTPNPSWVQRWLLGFEDPLEQEFRDDHHRAWRPRLRFNLWFAIFLYSSYLTLDFFLYQRFRQPLIYSMIFGVCMPSVLALLLLAYVQAWRPWMARFIPLALLLNGIGLSVASAIGVRLHMTQPNEVMVLQLLYSFFLLGMLFRAALPTAMVTLLAYAVVHAVGGADPVWLSDRLYFLGATVVIGAITCRLQEMTERRLWLQARELRELAQRDPLTGVHNHRAFHECGHRLLHQARRDGKSVAVVLIDVDHFKAYNDSHGHLAGDAALRRLAAVFADWTRRPLDMAARLGGEEFGLLWYDASLEGARKRAEELREAVVALGIDHAGGLLGRVTVSTGLIVGDGYSESFERLLGQADAALYRAKHEGRNRVCLATAL
ncbi:MAG TPA: diguanylate cyclase [Solimonas sp.]|nr:diguanylate cyclase [Solimonas sp.]